MKKNEGIFKKKKAARNGIYHSKFHERKKRKSRIKRQRLVEKNRLQQFVEEYQTEHKVKRYTLLYVILPMILVFIYECLGYKSLTGGFEFMFKHPWAYVCNVLIISISFLFALLFKKRLCVIMTLTLFWTFCAFGNFVLLCNRVTPLTGNDLALITDLFGIVTKYLSVFETILLVCVVIAAIAGIIIAFIKAPLECRKVHYAKSILIILAVGLLATGVFQISWTVGGVETQFHELSQSYKKNGFVYCFVNSLVDVGISKPDDYSQALIETLLEEDSTNESESAAEETDSAPNVVIVQLESFFDVNRLKDVTFSENPLPNLTALMESCGSGYFGVPVIGAGTVNTEFEVLTGMNIDDFGAGEYPYKTIMKKSTCETIAYNLKENGYATHALHDHVGSFYSRNQIYKNMGFDSFTSLEYMWPKSYTPMNWAKDVVLTEEIQKAMKSTEESDFIYAVSVQGHGSYPTSTELDYERHVTLSSETIEDEEYLNQLTYYVNQLYEMDQFIGELVEMLENSTEETILVMYGDHFPSLDIKDENLTGGNVYQTEYFIWNNMGLTYEDRDIEAYQVNSIVLESMDVKNGVINAYHQKSRKQLAEGTLLEEAYITGLKDLEYDILYGKQLCYNGVNPYEPTEMVMGTYPILLTEVVEDGEGSIFIHGENFTRYSKVYVNDEACSTWYISPYTLEVKEMDLEPGDQVTVRQKALSSTEVYIFQKELLETEAESQSETETQTDDPAEQELQQ